MSAVQNSFALLSTEDDSPAVADPQKAKKKKSKKKGAGGATAAAEDGPAAPPAAVAMQPAAKAPEPAKAKEPAAPKAKAKEPAAPKAKEPAPAPKAKEPVSAPAAEEAPEADGDDWQPSSKKKEQPLKKPLVWVDCEMTGLDLKTDVIMEIAVIVTDGSLNTAKEGPSIAIEIGNKALANMNDWCKEHHGASGLTQRCRESSHSMADAEQEVLAFISQYTEKGEAIIAGNSVYNDLAFIKKDMPKLAEHFHYRIVDVSSVKSLADRWCPQEFAKAPKKKNEHLALADIRESIAELKYYKQAIFKTGSKK